MSADIGETAIDYQLKETIKEAYKAKVFSDIGVQDENEDRHCSELSNRMKALDDKETFIVTKVLATNHWEVFKRTLEYLERREGA